MALTNEITKKCHTSAILFKRRLFKHGKMADELNSVVTQLFHIWMVYFRLVVDNQI